MLDLSRLHNVVDCLFDSDCRSKMSQYAGQTTAYQYLMLGEVWVGPPQENYLYIGNNTKSTQLVAHEFADLLTLHGIEHVRTRQNFTPLILISTTGQVFRFVGLDMAFTDIIWRGMRYGRAFLDIDDKTLTQLDESTAFTQLGNNILMSGADII